VKTPNITFCRKSFSSFGVETQPNKNWLLLRTHCAKRLSTQTLTLSTEVSHGFYLFLHTRLTLHLP